MIPKLSYTNSKNKNSEQKMEEIEEIQSNSLFSHMNQDNLKYLNSQIKHKKKQKNLHLSDNMGSVPRKNIPSHPSRRIDPTELISEKQSRYQSTSRELLNQRTPMDEIIARTEGENNLYISHQELRGESDQQTNKLSCYDLISQAKSKKLTSMDGKIQHESGGEFGKQPSNFIGFIQNYVSHLESDGSASRNMRKTGVSEEELLLLQEENQLLLSSVQKEKRKNIILAKSLEEFGFNKQRDTNRIRFLEQTINTLKCDVETLKNQWNFTSLRRKQQNRQDTDENEEIMNRNYESNMRNNFPQYPKNPESRRNEHPSHNRLQQLQNQLMQFSRNGIIHPHTSSIPYPKQFI